MIDEHTAHLGTQPEHESLIVASRRKELMTIVVALLGFSEEKIQFFDPEKPDSEIEHQLEPEGDDPFEAVQFKLKRVLELFLSLGSEKIDSTFYASDIVFSANGKSLHKPSREGAFLDEEKVKRELFEVYKEPFLASWHIAFGVVSQSAVNMGDIRIEAEYPGLTFEEVEKYFSPTANPGLRMVELGKEKQLSFKLYIAKDTEPIILQDEEGYKLAHQFIVQKLPTEEMFVSLLQKEIEQHPEELAMVYYGFLALAKNDVSYLFLPMRKQPLSPHEPVPPVKPDGGEKNVTVSDTPQT